MKLTRYDRPMTMRKERNPERKSESELTDKQRAKCGKRLTPEQAERIEYLIRKRNWPIAMVAADIGFLRKAVRNYCEKHDIKRPLNLNTHRKQSLRLTWSYMKRGVNPHRMVKAESYNYHQTLKDYKLLRSLTPEDRRAVFNFEEDMEEIRKNEHDSSTADRS